MKFLILLLSINFAYAQKAKLIVVSPGINADSVKDNFDVHHGSSHVSSLPDRQMREVAFEELKEINEWDELKKDIFYMDLKSKPLDMLKTKYPELAVSKLSELKGKIK